MTGRFHRPAIRSLPKEGLSGGIAVVVTLVYLATQLHQLKQQNLLASYQHTYDSLNAFLDVFSASPEIASLLVRCRQSTAGLSPEDSLRFAGLCGRLWNVVESWHFQVTQTTSPGPFRDEQLRNVTAYVGAYFDHPGVLEVWDEYKVSFNSEVQRLMTEHTGAG